MYSGFVSSLASCPEEQLELPDGATVGQLLQALAAKHGRAFRDAVAPGGSRPLTALISVDGRSAGLDSPLPMGRESSSCARSVAGDARLIAEGPVRLPGTGWPPRTPGLILPVPASRSCRR